MLQCSRTAQFLKFRKSLRSCLARRPGESNYWRAQRGACADSEDRLPVFPRAAARAASCNSLPPSATPVLATHTFWCSPRKFWIEHSRSSTLPHLSFRVGLACRPKWTVPALLRRGPNQGWPRWRGVAGGGAEERSKVESVFPNRKKTDSAA